MRAADKALTQYHLYQQARNAPALEMVKKLIREVVFAQVEEEIEAAKNTYDYEIVDAPSGAPKTTASPSATFTSIRSAGCPAMTSPSP